MESIIDKIYYSELVSEDNSLTGTSEYQEKVGELSVLEERVCEMLGKDNFDLFDEFDVARGRVASMENCDVFKQGFKLGVQMMVEILYDGDTI